MSSSADQIDRPRAVSVRSSDDELTVEFSDGRTISVPLSWYPRLEHATSEERQDWELIGHGSGIHWPAGAELTRAGSGVSAENRLTVQLTSPCLSAARSAARHPIPLRSALP